jgi:hypothetical protein
LSEKRPWIVTFIGDMNMLFALVSIASLFPGFLEGFGFYTIQSYVLSNTVIKLLLSITLLIASYGFLKLKKWGYWLMVNYNIFFLIVYICCLRNKQPYLSTNIMTTVIELIFVLPTKKYFYEERFPT